MCRKTHLKLRQMHRCFFEPGGPRVCHEASPGLTRASRNRRKVISYPLFILSVVFLLLWGCIVTNQVENFQAISVSQIGKPCLSIAKEQEDRAQWQHIRVPAVPRGALPRSARYSFSLQGSPHATSRVSGLVALRAEARWNTNFMGDLLETRLQIELWCNYELVLCVLQDWATCHWAQSTVHEATTAEPDSAASPPLSLN